MKRLFVQEASWAHNPSVLKRIELALLLDISNQVSKITAPTLITYGSDDAFTGVASQQLHTLIQSSVVKDFPGGHLFHLGVPKQFAAAVVQFVQGL